MTDWIGNRITYANVAATLALVFAVGGGTAVALKGVNKVRSDDIKNGQVKTRDLAGNAVNAAKLGPNSVGGSEIAANSVTGSDVDEGSLSGYPVISGLIKGDDGDVIEANSIGLTDAMVDRQGVGLICFDLSFTPKVMQVTPEGDGSAFASEVASIGNDGTCTPPEQDAVIHTNEVGGAPTQNQDIFVTFFK